MWQAEFLPLNHRVEGGRFAPVSPKDLLEHALQGGAYRERLAPKQISAEVLQPPLAFRGLLLPDVPMPLRAPCGEVVEEIRDRLANLSHVFSSSGEMTTPSRPTP